MKNNLLYLIICLLFGGSSFSQLDKNTEKIQAWFENKEYDKVIKFKKKKPESLCAQAVFYKGLAYYYQDDDHEALKLFTIASEKNPESENIFFFKGMSEMYLKKYNASIESMGMVIKLNPDYSDAYEIKGECHYQSDDFEKAIETLKKAISFESAKPRAHFILGLCYMEMEEYSKAVIPLKNSLAGMKPGTSNHNLASYNVGLAYQLDGNHKASKREFIEFLKHYPKDYQAMSKIVQACNALEEEKEAELYKEKLYEAHKNGKLEKPMRNMFCFDQFKYKEFKAMGFENFDEKSSGYTSIKYRYLIAKGEDSDNFDLKVYAERDTTKADAPYVVRKIDGDTAYTYSQFTFSKLESVASLREMVKKILDGNEQAEIFAGYKDHITEMSSFRLKNLDLDGSSFKKAVIAESVSWEYQWLAEYYPGYKFIQQALVFNDGTPYDILSIKYNGKKIEVHFNISSFFGKDFK